MFEKFTQRKPKAKRPLTTKEMRSKQRSDKRKSIDLASS